MPYSRSKIQQALVEELVSSKAVNLEQIAQLTGKYAIDAALRGDDITFHVGRNFIINCGWPIPRLNNMDLDSGLRGQGAAPGAGPDVKTPG